MRQASVGIDAGLPNGVAWTMQMKAVSREEPQRLLRRATGAILGGGGWVLSRGFTDVGRIGLVFEFERRACLDVYCALVGVGVELGAIGHRKLTELCLCTSNRQQSRGEEIARVHLEIQTL